MELLPQLLNNEFEKSEHYIEIYPQRISWWIYRRHLWYLYLSNKMLYDDQTFEDVIKKISYEQEIVNMNLTITNHIEWIMYLV